MKKPIILLTAIILTALSGCNKHPQPIILNKVESLMCSQPDSAYTLLASMNLDTLNAGSFARWCMLKGTVHLMSPFPLSKTWKRPSIGTRDKARKKKA